MYTLNFRIRFSEIDSTGRLSMDGLLRLFQDVGYLHAQDRGLGVEFTERTRRTWYLLSWQIHKVNMPLAGEDVIIETGIYNISGSLAKKSIVMKNSAGEILALGDTMWAYVDIDMGLPVEMEDELWLELDFTDHRDENIPVLSRRIKLYNDMSAEERVKITPYYIDTNAHANNVRLTELAMQICGYWDLDVASLRAEFKTQVKPDAWIYPFSYRDGKEITVVFKDTDNNIYSVFWFELK